MQIFMNVMDLFLHDRYILDEQSNREHPFGSSFLFGVSQQEAVGRESRCQGVCDFGVVVVDGVDGFASFVNS